MRFSKNTGKNLHSTFFLAHLIKGFIGAALIVLAIGCDQQPPAAPIPATPSALVLVKVAEAEEAQTHEEPSDLRESGVHVHGAASLDVVLEQALLNISISLPGMDAVGFEHPAATASEQATLNKALQQLQTPGALFLLSNSAGCTLKQGTVETGLLNTQAKPGTHTDIDAKYEYGCANPASLKNLSLELFLHFKSVQKIQANFVFNTKQGAMELTRDNNVLSFE